MSGLWYGALVTVLNYCGNSYNGFTYNFLITQSGIDILTQDGKQIIVT